MGRGRQKAKQTKVARQLKYSSPGPDLEALRAELLGGGRPEPVIEDVEESDEDDPYADLYADDEDDEDQDETA